MNPTTVKKKGKWIGEFAPNLGHDPNNPFPLPKQEGWEEEFDKFSHYQDFDGISNHFACPDMGVEVLNHWRYIKDFIASELSKSHQQGYAEGKQVMIQDLRRWMKGKQVTKEKVREYLNTL